jgi:Fic family protein
MPGEFRRSQNWIGGTRPGNAYFVPTPPHRVKECMGVFERFLHDENQPYPTLVKAALAHVQFETIHPFLDGNGRLGRLLISFILYEEGLLEKPLLYLSLYFKRHRSYYYDLLNQVRFEGDWERWIDFFLEGVALTAEDAVMTAKRLIETIQRDEKRIRQENVRTNSALLCLDRLSHKPVATIKTLCESTGLSYPSVSKALEQLQKMNIVEEITGKARNRVFRYRKLLEILNDEKGIS